MISLPVESSAHWYTAEGIPQHSATLRNARKENLYPSVTTIQKVLAKPALDAWKIQQAILSALTLPRIPGESDDAFAARVAKDMGEEAKQAASRGSEIHDMIHHRLLNGSWPEWIGERGLVAIATHVDGWISSNIKEVFLSENVLVHHEYGYAGTVDLVADTPHGLAVIDFKNQAVKEKGPNFYEEYAAQLAAYRYALLTEPMRRKYKCPGDRPMRLISVVINRVNPEPPHIKVWDEDVASKQWMLFDLARRAWFLQKGYSPEPK